MASAPILATLLTLFILSIHAQAQMQCLQNAMLLATCNNPNDQASCCASLSLIDPQCVCLFINQLVQSGKSSAEVTAMLQSCGIQYDQCSGMSSPPAPPLPSAPPSTPSLAPYTNSSLNCSSNLSTILDSCTSMQPACCDGVNSMSEECVCQGLQSLSSNDKSLLTTLCKLHPHCSDGNTSSPSIPAPGSYPAPASLPAPASSSLPAPSSFPTPSSGGDQPGASSTTSDASSFWASSFTIFTSAMVFLAIDLYVIS